MTTKLSNLFYTFLNIAASTQKLGINLIRVAILIIFVWIGGLKFYNYEAEGIRAVCGEQSFYELLLYEKRSRI